MPNSSKDSSSSNSRHQLPLPLEDLKAWIPSSDIYEWLEEGDAKAAAFQAELDAEGADQIANLFGSNNNNNDSNADDEEEASVASSDQSDADFEGFVGRIRVWTSSSTHVDGFGSKYHGVEADTDNDTKEKDGIRIVYIISESWEGYGDLLWASSRHLANQFADPTQCRSLLAPLWTTRVGLGKDDEQDFHPLTNLKVLELGAGCGVPSLMAMKCGARVVCTDLDNPNRIRCIAESMERNWREMKNKGEIYPNATLARACPFRWGASTEPVAKASILRNLEQSERAADGDGAAIERPKTSETFDVICATDCLFMPWLHYDLLAGMDELLAPDGVIVLAFAIHEAYSKDSEVWAFVDKAKEKGFDVEIMEAVQLTPPSKGMAAKQGLVHKLRLTRSS